MKKLIFVFALVSVLAVTGCGKSADVVSSFESPIPSSSTEEVVSSEESKEVSVPEAEPSSDESTDNTGGEDYCYST